MEESKISKKIAAGDETKMQCIRDIFLLLLMISIPAAPSYGQDSAFPIYNSHIVNPCVTPRLQNYQHLGRPGDSPLFSPHPLIDTAPRQNFLFALSDKSSSLSASSEIEADTEIARWGKGKSKNYLIPALEIAVFTLALNGVDRLIYGDSSENGNKTFSTTPSTFWSHVTDGDWVFDKDAYDVNQLGHPYQGSIYHGLARSAGLDFWKSLGYTFIGSFLWEVGGETSKPSINDQIASGIGGPFLGEPLFRIASLLLEDRSIPRFWRELGAAVVSPSTGFNRLLFGERFHPVFPSRHPALFWRFRLGWALNINISGHEANEIPYDSGTLDFSMSYGHPGKPGYGYTRPFDFFRFDVTGVSRTDPVENIMARGLLLGKEYKSGDRCQGIWGLFGSYDYISPNTFRVSSTAISGGTTMLWRLNEKNYFEGSAYVGIGYGAAGNVTNQGDRNYHYGAVPQGIVSLRLIMGDKAMFEADFREYYIDAPGSKTPPGSELIGRYSAAATIRISGRHAVGFQYLASFRDVFYPHSRDIHQRLGSFSVVYTYLSDTTFGAAEWRDKNNMRLQGRRTGATE